MSGMPTGDTLVASLPEIADRQAALAPDALYLRFLENGEAESAQLSFADLAHRARALAGWLRTIASPGERALLAYPAGPDFPVAFLACLYAGIIAVPVDAPRRRADAGRLAAIAASSGASLFLAHGVWRDRLPDLGARWLFTDTHDAAAIVPADVAAPALDTIAYLQYTSGSTQAPRGAAISHRALIEQLEYYSRRAEAGGRALVFTGWLPHTHDFGLVGFVLAALYMARPYVWMPPSAFLRRPMRWIEAIARYRGSYSGGPSFAYEMCAADGPRGDLDLRCWKIASLGGDYIAPATLARFEAAFAPAGFRAEAWFPAYGLAEAVLCATGRMGAAVTSFDAAALRANRAAPATGGDAIALVSCGAPMPGQRLCIVDPGSRAELPEDRVGEIWLSGTSLARGYWNDVAATTAAFDATIAGDDAPHLRTGDCGFLHGGELFVTGRLKDLIVVNGRNHAPDDLEQTIQDADPALRRRGGAVFQADAADGARLIAVQEVSRGADAGDAALFAAINRAVTARHGIALDAIMLVRAGRLPRTSTGKIARAAARTAYAAHALGDGAHWARPVPTEAEIGARLREILPGVPIGVNDNLFALGLDSLGLHRLIGWIATRYGVELQLEAVLAAPTVAGLARLLPLHPAPAAADPVAGPLEAALAEVRRLHALVAEQTRRITELTTPPRDAPFPLTEIQREIRLLPRLRPGAETVFITLMVLEFASAPDRAAVRRALDALARRHEALRTLFETDAEQRVLAEATPDLNHVTTADADERRAWLAAEGRHAFAPDRTPPWRATLLDGAGGHLFVLAAHHLVLDGASLGVFAREFTALYADDGAALPEPMQFREFGAALEQRRAAAATHAGWWQTQLGADLPDWQPPRPPPAPHRVRYDVARQPVTIDAGLRAALVRRGAAHGATLFQTLFAAYAVLLHRVSGQDRVAIGIDAANRDRDAEAGVIGCCNALVPVVLDFTDPRAPAVQARDRIGQALARRDYTLSMWAQDQRIAPNLARPFKINATINFQRFPTSLGPFVTRFDLEAEATTQSPFGVTLDVRNADDALRLDFVHNPQFLGTADAARFANYYSRLLAALAGDAACDLLTVPILGPSEEAQLAAWSRAAAPAPAFVPMLDRFAAQVAATPDARAIRCPCGSLSYDALDRLADRIAAAIALRCPPGRPVALLATRGCTALAAMLAIWKAGCVCVPLDAKAPEARLRRMLGQTGAALLLHDGDHPAPAAGIAALALDALPEAAAPPIARPAADMPAYLLFTSGSSGVPKAASVSHGGMANHLQAKLDLLGLRANDRVAQTAAHSFDIALWQYLAPLLAGGEVCVLDNVVTHDPGALFAACDRLGVTVLQLVPATLRGALERLIRPGARLPLSELRWLISTGEALAADLCRRWIALYPRIPLVNAYGPTECSDDVTHHVAEWAPPPAAAWVPIGRPIRGAELHVVDARGVRTPPGTPGELLVGGRCVGLGYHGDPDRTAAAFVPDRFSGRAAARLYRTGDVVRYQPDGVLDYLGRLDQQLKINGVRIEPGEIEDALLHDPALLAAHVTTRPRADGTPALVAYVVLRPGKAVNAGTLKAVARNTLPPAMVPAAFVFLDVLPLTPHGKIDGAALPAPDLAPRRAAPSPPTTALEHSLVRIWSETIGQGAIGVHDDFFDLGGRSLDATCIARKVESEFKIRFPVAEIFRKPTVHDMAIIIESAMHRNRPVPQL